MEETENPPKMGASLPIELITTEILIKLPVKSLNRFKCVSKTWNSLITSSNFIKQHLRQTLISNTNTKIIISTNSIVSSAVSAAKLRFDIVTTRNIPHSPRADIIESVHGVLLIVDPYHNTVCLFNPSNKTQRLVPPAPSPKPRYLLNTEVFGFGYDSVRDDYKVVRSALWNVSADDDWGDGSGFYKETCVYSMQNDSWESVNDETSVFDAFMQMKAVSVEEKLYFLISKEDSQPRLKCFDLRTSTFSLVDFPKFDKVTGDEVYTLRSLRGCLSLLLSYRNFNLGFLYADVWEMKEYKWVKLFSIQKNEILNNEIRKHCSYLRLVTYSKDMKSVLIEVDSDWYGWYDLVTKKFKEVPVQGLAAVKLPYVAYTYVETLVSVVNNKVVSMEEGITRPKKNDFPSSGFKLML